jgi:hypothetical protein
MLCHGAGANKLHLRLGKEVIREKKRMGSEPKRFVCLVEDEY